MFPKTVINTGSAVMRLMMKKDTSGTNGNILNPSAEPHRIYGETMLPPPSRTSKLLMVSGLLAAGAYMLWNRSQPEGKKQLK